MNAEEEPEAEESLKNQSNQRAALVQVTAILRVGTGSLDGGKKEGPSSEDLWRRVSRKN